MRADSKMSGGGRHLKNKQTMVSYQFLTIFRHKKNYVHVEIYFSRDKVIWYVYHLVCLSFYVKQMTVITGLKLYKYNKCKKIQ